MEMIIEPEAQIACQCCRTSDKYVMVKVQHLCIVQELRMKDDYDRMA